MRKNRSLSDLVETMQNMAQMLIPYTVPKATPYDEDEVDSLKAMDTIVDGYPVTVHLSRAEFDDYYLETLHIFSKQNPFLPFAVVCKIAKKFLGSHHLSLIEIFENGKRLYCWTVALDDRGRPIKTPYKQKEVEHLSYEGLSYDYLHPDQVNFY